MAFEETRALIEEVHKLGADQKGPFVTWLVITLIRDISYYIVTGLVVWALGRRLIQAIMAAYRESRREHA